MDPSSDKLAELYEHYNKLDTAKDNIAQVGIVILFCCIKVCGNFYQTATNFCSFTFPLV